MDDIAHLNVICSMLYQRGERQSTPGIRTVSARQIQNVVSKYNLRENVCVTTHEIRKASTDRWSVSPTMEADRFLILQRMPV